MTPHPDTIKAAVDLFRPPQRLKISEWAEQFAFIPHEGNEEPGKYHLSRMPHQAAMLDDPLDPAVRESFWMIASQFGGKTLCLSIILEYAIKVLKRSSIAVRPTRQMAIDWMRDKFLPLASATPAMAGLLRDPRKRDSRSTSLNRRFDGGNLQAIGAKSPSAFRGTSAGIVLQDEIDSYEAGKEGDPCALGDRAAETFADSWKIKSSTPTLKGFSRIDVGFESGDQQKYFVPCPCCGEFQDLKFAQLKFSFTAEEYAHLGMEHWITEYGPERVNACTWELGEHPIRDTRRALYVCEHCHRGWTDRQRIAAYLSGHKDNPPVIVDGKELRAEWRATAPFKGIRSRHLNGMYGTIGLKKGFANYLHWFAEKFLTAKASRESLMVWTNLFLAEPFEDASEKTDWKVIKERAEDYGPELPVEVMLLISGIDVHPDRVECATYGWGDQEEVWAIDYEVFTGDFDMPAAQELVESYVVGKRWKHPILGELGLAATCVDSGHQTRVKAVYQFCKRLREKNVYAVKGFASALGSLYTVADERRFKIKRYNLNVDAFKDTISSRLRMLDKGPRFIHFPMEVLKDGSKTPFTARFYSQLCSERRMFSGGTWIWKKPTSNTRNEALDTLVYAFGGWEILRAQTYVAKKWREVLSKIKAAETVAAGPKVYELDAVKEVKQPDLRQVRDVRRPAPEPRGEFAGWSKGYRGKWR